MWWLILFLIVLAFTIAYRSRHKPKEQSCAIVVLGDFGHSPRMQQHALSLLSRGYQVNVVSYLESSLHASLAQNKALTILKLSSIPRWLSSISSGLFYFVVKTIYEGIDLMWTLYHLPHISFLIVQNPPAVPALLLTALYSRLVNAKLVFDWHNYGYTILAMKTSGIILRLYTYYERFMARFSHINVCVSNAMHEDLASNWLVDAKVLYDRPIVDRMVELSRADRSEFLHSLEISPLPKFSNSDWTDYPVLVSSTSWTPDEDFSVLFLALRKYDEAVSLQPEKFLPPISCFITGKGPEKEKYMSRVKDEPFKNVYITSSWLKANDYPKMLASADLGICLHTSSSGVDLPMKVVDMFGVKLPVCAVNYKCISELVTNGVDGLLFTDSNQLFEHLVSLLSCFPTNHILESLKSGAALASQAESWDSQWERVLWPLLIAS